MTGYLSSWNDGMAKPGIPEFARAGVRGAPGFVLPPDRAAACDHDAALCGERPACPQAGFLARCWVVSMRDDFKVVFDL